MEEEFCCGAHGFSALRFVFDLLESSLAIGNCKDLVRRVGVLYCAVARDVA